MLAVASHLAGDPIIVAILLACVIALIVLVVILGALLYLRTRRPEEPHLPPLEEARQGLRHMVEQADWLEGEQLIQAVHYVAIARDAIEHAARACGRNRFSTYQVPAPLSRALEDGVDIVGGGSAVITFDCHDCGQRQSAMIQFPKVGGRPETRDAVTISATIDWRDVGFTIATPCKRCKKLLTRKLLYDTSAQDDIV